LVAAREGSGLEDDALLEITPAGRAAFLVLAQANVRSPSSDDLNKLVIALKMRFLHLLPREVRVEQIQALIGLFERELARLEDLAQAYGDEPGYFAGWLAQDITQNHATLAWFRRLLSATEASKTGRGHDTL
jgi:hypothetical protein